MKKQVTALLLLLISCSMIATPGKSPVDYVNPLMGSLSTKELSAGNTYPVMARPWGMNFWTPQTGKMGNGWIYTYTADKINGFKQTHQPSPWIKDYGQFALMPTVDNLVFEESKRASWFSHKAEVAKPYYYKVYLADYHLETELTTTCRAAMFRITYPKTDSAGVVIDALDSGSAIEVDLKKNRITGYTTKNRGGVPDNFKNYFVIEFDKPISDHQIFINKKAADNGLLAAEEDHVGVVLRFKTADKEQVIARVASSFISHQQALINLNEVINHNFDELVQEGKDEWNNVLGKIEVKDNNVDQLRTFYSCLYRCVLFPRKFYEYDATGAVVHYSPYNGEVLPGYMYTDTGFWDTFRSLFPLLNLVYPEENLKIQEGLVNTALESGFLPEWASPGHRDCMVGNNSASVVADAYLKGVRVKNIEAIWDALVYGTKNRHPEVKSTGRWGHEYYNKLGYVPYDVGIKESAARSLEYAYNDWCIYKLGKALNKPNRVLKEFKERAYNYKKLFDTDHKLMRGKNEDGTFQTPFNPFKWGDAFTEGNSWHYTWSVFHDPEGLIKLMGGEQSYNAMLDSIFTLPPVFDDSYYGRVIHEIREMQIANMGNYAHGNQPIQHMIYMYDYAKEPWKAQYWAREVMDRMYSATPDGYCGDEDNGQTSAWYVFSALGFYPLCPASDQYAIGSPLFDLVTINLPNEKKLVLEAKENKGCNRYIKSIMVNNNSWSKNYFTFKQLRSGGVITYTMQDTPNKNRGVDETDKPYSFSTSK